MKNATGTAYYSKAANAYVDGEQLFSDTSAVVKADDNAAAEMQIDEKENIPTFNYDYKRIYFANK